MLHCNIINLTVNSSLLKVYPFNVFKVKNAAFLGIFVDFMIVLCLLNVQRLTFHLLVYFYDAY